MSHQTIIIREEDVTLRIDQVVVPSRDPLQTSTIKLPVGGAPLTFVDENDGLLLTLDEDGNIISEKGFFELSGQAAPALSPAGKMRLYFDSGINKLLLSENGGAYTDIMDGSGNVVGPASANDNALARFNATTGKLIQNSLVTVDDLGNLSANATVGPHFIGNFRINLDIIARVGGGQIDFGNGSPFEFTSDESDSASAVAFDFNILTGGGLSTAGAKLISIRNNSVEKLSVDKDGNIILSGVFPNSFIQGSLGKLTMDSAFGMTLDFNGNGTILLNGNGIRLSTSVGSTQKIVMESGMNDSASAVAYELDTTNTLSTVGAKLLSIRNNTAEKFFVGKDGNVAVISGGVAILSMAIESGNGSFVAGSSGSNTVKLISNDTNPQLIALGDRMLVHRAERSDVATGVAHKFDTGGVVKTTAGFRVFEIYNGRFDTAAHLIISVDKDGDIMIAGDLNHDGSNVGFYGTTPAAQSAAYTRNATVVEDRTLLASASATTLNNNNILAALIVDLQAVGIIG